MTDRQSPATIPATTGPDGPDRAHDRDPLRRRLWIVAVALLLVTAAGTVFVDSVRSAMNAAEAAAQAQGTVLSEAIVEHAAATFGSAGRILDEAARRASVPAGTGNSPPDAALELAVSFVPGILGARASDATGAVRAGTAPAGAPAQAASDALFAAIRAGDSDAIRVSAPFASTGTGDWRVLLGRRVTGPGGAFAGAVAVTVDLDRFRDFYSRLDVGANGTVGLWRDDAVLLTRHPFDAAQIGRQVANELLASFRKGGASDSIVIASAIDGTQRRISWHRVPGVPLIVTVGNSTLAYREALYAALRQQSLAAVAGAVLIPLLALLLWVDLGRLADTLDGYRRLSRQIGAERNALAAANAELSAANAQVVKANAAKSEFLANVSHELRTPLNAIIGFSDIMRSEALGSLPPRYRDYSSDIHASAEHLLEIVSDIIDLQRIEKGDLGIALTEIDAGRLARDCARLLSVLSDSKRIAVVLETPPEPAILRSDGQRVMQIMVNLLSNSIKYSDEGTTVVVNVAREAGGVVIGVADSGIGMSEDEVELALQPFRQVAMVRRRTNDSIGLGLPIVRGLVDALGGVLKIESRKGHGTSITVRLPSVAA